MFFTNFKGRNKMLQSKLIATTKKEWPSEATIKSH